MYPLRFLLLVSCVLAWSCGQQAGRRSSSPSIGEAFAGPATLPLRQEIAPNSSTATTVKHGDRLEVLQIRRRFVRVRTAAGLEGWTDVKQLLSAQQMGELRQLSGYAAKLPSQGAAKALDVLNMHARPNRQSPSFYQISEGKLVDVLAHKVTPRNATEPVAPLVPPRPKVVRKKKERRQRGATLAIPAPQPPGVPDNWLALSKSNVPPPSPAEIAAAERKRAEEERLHPVKLEDWLLVRTPDKKAGWVLSRMISMAIPDEVAQYSEGQHLTSYFSLGTVDDDGQTKHHWIWTTASKNALPCDFDGFRVFIWSRRRHRYETVYRERDLVGYYPISIHRVPITLNKKPAEAPGFSIVAEGEDGKPYRYTYWFDPSRVRLLSKDPVVRPQDPASGAGAPEFQPTSGQSAPVTELSWWSKLKARLFKSKTEGRS